MERRCSKFLKNSHVLALSFSPEGKHLACACFDDLIRIFRTDDFHSASLVLRGHKSCVTSLSWHPTENTLASGSSDRQILIWSIENGTLRQTLREATYDIQVDRGRTILEVPESHLRAKSRRAIDPSAFEEAQASRRKCGFVEKDRVEWMKGSKGATESARIVRVGSGHQADVTGLSFHENGTLLISSGGQSVILWTVASSGMFREAWKWTTSDLVFCALFRPNNGKLLAAGTNDGSVVVWELSNRKRVCVLRGHSGAVSCLAWHPTQQILATGSEDRTVVFWDLSTMAMIDDPLGTNAQVWSLAFQSAGTLLAAALESNAILLWDCESRMPLQSLEMHLSAVTSLAWHPESFLQLASGGVDRQIIIYEGIGQGAESTALNSVRSGEIQEGSQVVLMGFLADSTIAGFEGETEILNGVQGAVVTLNRNSATALVRVEASGITPSGETDINCPLRNLLAVKKGLSKSKHGTT